MSNQKFMKSERKCNELPELIVELYLNEQDNDESVVNLIINSLIAMD